MSGSTKGGGRASGDRLLRACWLLLGTAFVAVAGFAIVTVLVKGDRSPTTEAMATAVAQNADNPSAKQPAPKDNKPDEELLPLHPNESSNRLVRADEVDRVLGSSFNPPPANDDSPPPTPPSLPPPLPPVKPPTLPALPVDPPKSDVTPPPPAVDPPAAPKVEPRNADVAVEKRLQSSESAERERLLAVPELRLFSDLEIEAFREQEKTAQPLGRPRVLENSLEFAYNARLNKAMLQAGRKEGLPLQLGANSRLDFDTATIVQTLSKNLRDLGFVSVPGTPSRVIFPGAAFGKGAIVNNAAPQDKTKAFKEWCDVNKVEKFRGALATLLQMLQVEDVPTRLMLVRELAKVKSAGATAALAKRAMVDQSPEVRDAAVAALEKRPTGQYVPVLLQGLRYPWPPVADRAALALRKLKPEGALPKLVALLDQPDPAVPVLDKRSKKSVVRELVRLNHMRNCFLCHAPSANDKDGLVRGLAPTPGKPLPRLYYAGQSGNFVRADTTFLRQDFSVNLPVEAAAPWPDEQRFDFITRIRQASPDELAKIAAKPNPDLNYPQREAVQYALRGISGKDGGMESDMWRDLLGIAKEKDAALDKPAKDKEPSLDKPAKDKEPSLDKPAKDKAKPAPALPPRIVIDPGTGKLLKRLPPAPPIAELPFEKRIKASEDDLQYQLVAVPELTLIADKDVQAVRAGERTATSQEPYNADNLKLAKAFHQAGLQASLPLQSGAKCRLDARTAAVVQTVSKELRSEGFVAFPGSTNRRQISQVAVDGWIQTVRAPTPPERIERFRKWCDQNKVEKARGGLAALLQILQVEDAPIRLLLVRELAKVSSPESTAVLAKRAVMDLAADVRQAAVAALQKRPTEQYLPILLSALRHPWTPVADHAALALEALKPKGALPPLVDLLDQPNPAVPVLDKKTKRGMVPELVRLNHLRHCLLCHAPSMGPRDGLVRGFIPEPGVSLGGRYYGAPALDSPAAVGNFVRADTTFLRQDFSVNLPVKDAGQWPSEQRFDFVTRLRPANPEEMAQIAAKPDLNYPQREAVRYALRGISGKEGGTKSETWRELLGIARDKNAVPAKD